MSKDRVGEGMVLNWRGPLLTAAIFAAAFGILLLMAHQNESNTSDMGSSLREDPYGASLLFDSYARAGYQVKRSQDEDSLSDENALSTTAFFIGGRSFYPGTARVQFASSPKLSKRIEDFLARGGRVVLVAPDWKLKSESQGWEIEDKWNKGAHLSGPNWISPTANAMPAGTEKIFVESVAPWLQTDPGWTVLYDGHVESSDNADVGTHVYMAMRRAGKGELIAASQESFLLNETIKTHPNPALLDFLAGGRRVVWVDETLHGLQQDLGVLWLVHRYRLQAALLLFWATLVVLLWSMSGDLVRRPTRDPGAQIVRNSEGAGVAARRLLQRSIARGQVVAECWEEFRRRSPQDAEAIVSDPQKGPRLRTALSQSPVAGYMELSQLIAERRASARGLRGTDREARDRSTSPKKTAEEAKLA